MEARQPGNATTPQSHMAALAGFSAFVAAEADGDRIISRALDVLTAGLGLDHAVFLALSPEQDALVVHMQRGWEGEHIEGERRILDFVQIPALPSPGGELIEIGNTSEGTTFFPEQLLRLRAFSGGLAVLLHAGPRPLGVIAALSVTHRRFAIDEKEFVLTIAGMVSAALVSDKRRESRLQQAPAAGQQQRVFVLDDQGRVLRTNRAAEERSPGGMLEVRNKDVHDFVHPSCRSEHCTVKTALRRVCERALSHGSSQEDIHDGPSGHLWRLWATRCDGDDLEDTNLPLPAIVLLIDDVTEEKNVQGVLQEQKARIRALRSAVIEAQEVERRRVAAELHDGIGQSLTALKFWVEANLLECKREHRGNAASVCKSIVRRIQQSIDEVRRISLNLRPSMLDDLGLVVTLNWLCREFLGAHAGFEIVKEIDCDDLNVPEPLKNVIFRVTQEALNNVAKHAGATKVTLSLRCKKNVIVLKIVDNGSGFDASAMSAKASFSGGLGLKSMRERAEASGGHFELVSSAHGTTIEVVWGA